MLALCRRVRSPGALFSLPSTPRGGAQPTARTLRNLFTRELSSEHGVEGIGSSGASPRILGRGTAHSSLGGLTPSKKAGETD